MAKYYEENSDAVNRCERCNRPLNDPTADYGWWCAKLLGYGDYQNKNGKLDYDNLNVYNEDDNDLVYLYDSLPKKLLSDKDRYGENSKVYIALDNLNSAYKAFPGYKNAIDIVDNEIRWIGNEWGSQTIDEGITNIYNKIDSLNNYLPEKHKINVNLTTVEQVLAAAYQDEAVTFNVARMLADMYTKEIYNQDGDGTGVANAFKHIYWSAYATKVLGEDYAKLFTHAHEFGWWEENKNDTEAMKMDLHNNQLGRKIGKETPFYVDLKDVILSNIEEGKAAVIIDGKSMLYKP